MFGIWPLLQTWRWQERMIYSKNAFSYSVSVGASTRDGPGPPLLKVWFFIVKFIKVTCPPRSVRIWEGIFIWKGAAEIGRA